MRLGCNGTCDSFFPENPSRSDFKTASHLTRALLRRNGSYRIQLGDDDAQDPMCMGCQEFA